MMVMMTANTPSLKASMRPLVIRQYETTNGNSSTTARFDVIPGKGLIEKSAAKGHANKSDAVQKC
jgi:hypothetical protein